MNRFRFYIGTNKKNGQPVTETDWMYIEDYLISHYSGFSQYDVRGAWRNENGFVIEENSRVYEVISDDALAGGSILAVYAEQESVLVTTEPVIADFCRGV